MPANVNGPLFAWRFINQHPRNSVVAVNELAARGDGRMITYAYAATDIEFTVPANEAIVAYFDGRPRAPDAIEFEIDATFEITACTNSNLMRPSDVESRENSLCTDR